MQLKYSNYVAFSHFHGKAVNNSGLTMRKSGMNSHPQTCALFRS